MAIAAVAAAAAGAVTPTLPTLSTVATPGVDAAGAAGAAGAGGDFKSMVSGAIDSLNGAQAKADGLAVQAATGQLTDVHDYMIAATEANLTTELTVAVRNKAVESFNDIMRMQV